VVHHFSISSMPNPSPFALSIIHIKIRGHTVYALSILRLRIESSSVISICHLSAWLAHSLGTENYRDGFSPKYVSQDANQSKSLLRWARITAIRLLDQLHLIAKRGDSWTATRAIFETGHVWCQSPYRVCCSVLEDSHFLFSMRAHLNCQKHSP
jgi:hypothetical protein